MNNETAVLDIGSSKITVVIGARGVNNTFNIRGRGEAEYDGFSEGEFYEPAKLREAFLQSIKIAETKANTKIEKIYVGIPGEFCSCFVNDVSIALNYKHKIVKEDINDLFRQGRHIFVKEALDSSIIACAPVYFMLDDNRRIANPIGNMSSRLSGSISYIFAKADFLQNLSNILKDSGITEVEFTPSVLSSVIYLFEPEKRDGYVLLIDVGHITTNIILARGDGILGLRTVSMGGGHITGALYAAFEPPEYIIAEALKRKVVLSLDAAEKDVYEIVYKSENYKFNAREANNIVRECVNGLSELIKQEINTFDYQYPEYINFHLTGGGLPYIRGAKEILSKTLDKPIELIMPSVPQLDKPELSSILGLLDDAIEKNALTEKKESFFMMLKRLITGK